jgi:hypothetical protein
VSVVSLLIVLFFGITGITLNHPDWTFGADGTVSTETGALPQDSIVGGEVEFLLVSEFVRDEHGVHGEVNDFGAEGGEATITYKAPGYAAELRADVATGDYSLTVREEGFVSVMNDLHKGRDAGTAWRWVIDISGGLLVVIGLTGIGIQFFLRRRRISALSLAVAGGVLTTISIWVAATT